MTKRFQHFIDLNRKAWDSHTPYHVQSAFYDLDSFLKGNSSLNSTEIEEIGEVQNKNTLHLQCHFGMDTLSLERQGAVTTGIDFSNESITEARKLASRLGLNSRFIQSDIYGLTNSSDVNGYDLIFTSYGVLFWLPDLEKWADIIFSLLKPGGRFYIIEFHPFLNTLDEKFRAFKYPYFKDERVDPLSFSERGSYADPEAPIQTTTFGWSHSMSEIVTSLLESGLELHFLHEFPFSHYNIFPDMISFSPGKYHHRELQSSIPYMFSIMASKSQ